MSRWQNERGNPPYPLEPARLPAARRVHGGVDGADLLGVGHKGWKSSGVLSQESNASKNPDRRQKVSICP